MTNSEKLIKKADIQQIAKKGSKIYEKIKIKYEPRFVDKFLAIEVTSKEVFIGNTSSEAVEKARLKYPNKVFYVVKIGSSVAETLANLYSIRK